MAVNPPPPENRINKKLGGYQTVERILNSGARSQPSPAPWGKLGHVQYFQICRRAMSQYNSTHFIVSQLEDGWMLQSDHVTKIQTGDWILDREELEELSALLQSVLTRS